MARKSPMGHCTGEKSEQPLPTVPKTQKMGPGKGGLSGVQIDSHACEHEESIGLRCLVFRHRICCSCRLHSMDTEPRILNG